MFTDIEPECNKIIAKHVELVMRYRRLAEENKNNIYKREMYANMALWREERVINWADKIIQERGVNHV